MNITIKKSEIEDIELLVKWRIEVLREVFEIPTERSLDELRDENEKYYLSELASGGHIACFAYLDGKIIGCGGVCIYREMPSPDNLTGMCAYLMNIYTRPDYRKMGVGNKIVNWLIKRAEEKGITKIYLETSKAGEKLYRKIGFSDMKNILKFGGNQNA